MAIEGLPTESDAQLALNRLPVITQGVFSDWRALITSPEQFMPRFTNMLETRPHEEVVRLMQSLSAEDAYTAFARIQYQARSAFTNDNVTTENARKDAQIMLGYMRLHIAKNYSQPSFHGRGAIFLHDTVTDPFIRIRKTHHMMVPEHSVTVRKPGDTRIQLVNSMREGSAVLLHAPSSGAIALVEVYGRLNESQREMLKEHGMHRKMHAIVIGSEPLERQSLSLAVELHTSGIVAKEAHVSIMPIQAERVSVVVFPGEQKVGIDFHDGVQHGVFSLESFR